MTESAFELVRSDWSCSQRRSLNEGGVWGGTARKPGEANGFQRQGRPFLIFFALFSFLFSFVFRLVFLFIFVAVLGAQKVPKREPKSTNIVPSWAQDGFLKQLFVRKVNFQKHLKKQMKINILSPRCDPKRPKIDPRRPQDGLMSCFFSLLFFDRFLVASWCHFGSIWGGFWGPKSVILGVGFLMIFTCCS